MKSQKSLKKLMFNFMNMHSSLEKCHTHFPQLSILKTYDILLKSQVEMCLNYEVKLLVKILFYFLLPSMS